MNTNSIFFVLAMWGLSEKSLSVCSTASKADAAHKGDRGVKSESSIEETANTFYVPCGTPPPPPPPTM